MSSNVALSLVSSNVSTIAPSTEKKTAITDNERDNMVRAFSTLHGIVKTMGKGETDIGDNFTTDANTLGELLACAHRVWKEELDAKRQAVAKLFAGKIDALIQVALDKRNKAIVAFNAMDADLRAELPTPSPIVSVWVTDLLPAFGSGYDIHSATKTLHDMGYMVHLSKTDGRKKDQSPTPPYVTASVGQPIRRGGK